MGRGWSLFAAWPVHTQHSNVFTNITVVMGRCEHVHQKGLEVGRGKGGGSTKQNLITKSYIISEVNHCMLNAASLKFCTLSFSSRG